MEEFAIKSLDLGMMAKVEGFGVCLIPLDEMNKEQWELLLSSGIQSSDHLTSDYTAIEVVHYDNPDEVVYAINKSSMTETDKQQLIGVYSDRLKDNKHN